MSPHYEPIPMNPADAKLCASYLDLQREAMQSFSRSLDMPQSLCTPNDSNYEAARVADAPAAEMFSRLRSHLPSDERVKIADVLEKARAAGRIPKE